MRRKKDLAKNGHTEGKRPTWPLLLGLALITLFATVSCGGAAGEQREDPLVGGSRVGPEEPQAGADLGHPALGNENAPVVLIEYADFQ